jgi:hypothetical protein
VLLTGAGFAPGSLMLVNGQVVPTLFEGNVLQAQVSRRLLRRHRHGREVVVQVLTPGVGLSVPVVLPVRGRP